MRRRVGSEVFIMNVKRVSYEHDSRTGCLATLSPFVRLSKLA
jgi:hypothetical protein